MKIMKVICSAIAVSAIAENPVNRNVNSETPATPILGGRRNLAVLHEDMFCERENSCLTMKEKKTGWAGPLTAFWECVDMSTGEHFPITTYIRSMNNSNLKDKVYCEKKPNKTLDSRMIGHTGENPTNPMLDIRTIDSRMIGRTGENPTNPMLDIRTIDSRMIGHTGENPTNLMLDIRTIDSNTIASK
jgi:hypothetical protein